jgi:hypothetical protein
MRSREARRSESGSRTVRPVVDHGARGPLLGKCVLVAYVMLQDELAALESPPQRHLQRRGESPRATEGRLGAAANSGQAHRGRRPPRPRRPSHQHERRAADARTLLSYWSAWAVVRICGSARPPRMQSLTASRSTIAPAADCDTTLPQPWTYRCRPDRLGERPKGTHSTRATSLPVRGVRSADERGIRDRLLPSCASSNCW